jgi:AAA+ superfamily predicted ATPase
MLINEELTLLIKSKYPVVFFECIDEEYVLSQLRMLAFALDMVYYQWSITDGLSRGISQGEYYQTKDPTLALKTILDFFREKNEEAGLFVLKDFQKYLENDLILRLFRDLMNCIRGTKSTIILLGAEYKIPKDIEPETAHIIGGYPDEQEISSLFEPIIQEITLNHPQVKVSLSPEDIQNIITSLKGLSLQQIKNILYRSALDDNLISGQDLSNIEKYKKELFDQQGLLEFYPAENKNNLANFDNLKKWLEERKGAFAKGQDNRPSSIPPPKGVLIMGVQGCGKSLAVKIIAQEFSLPLYRIDIARMYSKFVGETEQNLLKALMTAERLSPLCLWVDEIEKGLATSAGDVDGGVSQRLLGTFLTWMQERKTTCFLAATANNVWRLPPELLRKGRFDEIFFVELPDLKTREILFKIHLKKRGIDPDKFNCRLLAESSADFNGAEIEQAIISAFYCASKTKKDIETQDILEQLRSTKPLAVLKQEDISELRQWAKERTIPA